MIEEKDIDHLTHLARLEISPAEKRSLKKDLSNILNYVSELKQAPVGSGVDKDTALVKNVMRDDAIGHEPGQYSEKLLAAAPDIKNGFIKVKKIIG